VARGRTSYPRRPIWAQGFTIGSGENCDLRLGGNEIPAIHSTIHFDGQQTRLNVIAPVPPVTVNGRSERSAALRPGDQLRIGEFEFLITDDSEETDAAEGDPSGLSAEQLVDLIERETRLVEEFESGRRAGADALLAAVAAHASASDAPLATTLADDSVLPPLEEPDEGADADVLHDIEKVLAGVNLFAEELQLRSQRVLEREGSYAEASAILLEFQQRLSSQLEMLTGTVTQIHARLERVEKRRAIA
jgi:hypothetical protein